VIAENIRRFHALLEQERSVAQRKLLLDLLHEEERKLLDLRSSPEGDTGSSPEGDTGSRA
jgi:hypothetical protein